MILPVNTIIANKFIISDSPKIVIGYNLQGVAHLARKNEAELVVKYTPYKLYSDSLLIHVLEKGSDETTHVSNVFEGMELVRIPSYNHTEWYTLEEIQRLAGLQHERMVEVKDILIREGILKTKT